VKSTLRLAFHECENLAHMLNQVQKLLLLKRKSGKTHSDGQMVATAKFMIRVVATLSDCKESNATIAVAVLMLSLWKFVLRNKQLQSSNLVRLNKA